MAFGEEFANELNNQNNPPSTGSGTGEPTPPATEPVNPTPPVTTDGNGEPPATPPVNTEPIAYTNEGIVEYLRSQGRAIESFDDLFKAPEPVIQKETVEVNPWETILDEEDLQYLNYKKETGRSRSDWEQLSRNYDEASALDLARDRVRLESGQKLTNDQADAYLEKKLGITLLDGEEIDPIDMVDLASYAKPLRDTKKQEQEQYRKPIERQASTGSATGDMVTLENGAVMPKAKYQELVDNHQKHVEAAKNSVDSVAGFTFSVDFDDNGSTRKIETGYELSPEDKQRLVSKVTNVESIVNQHRTEQGFNHEAFNEDVFWSDKALREKAINSMINKALADHTEELLKLSNNVNFNRSGMPQNADGKKIAPIIGSQPTVNGFPSFFKPNN